jgi:hypothetical protein
VENASHKATKQQGRGFLIERVLIKMQARAPPSPLLLCCLSAAGVRILLSQLFNKKNQHDFKFQLLWRGHVTFLSYTRHKRGCEIFLRKCWIFALIQ